MEAGFLALCMGQGDREGF